MLNPWDKASIIYSLERALKAAEMMHTTTPCNGCIHFEQGKCRRWGEVVPAETLLVGCSEWVFNRNSCPF